MVHTTLAICFKSLLVQITSKRNLLICNSISKSFSLPKHRCQHLAHKLWNYSSSQSQRTDFSMPRGRGPAGHLPSLIRFRLWSSALQLTDFTNSRTIREPDLLSAKTISFNPSQALSLLCFLCFLSHTQKWQCWGGGPLLSAHEGTMPCQGRELGAPVRKTVVSLLC